jgi:hypothetical protein
MTVYYTTQILEAKNPRSLPVIDGEPLKRRIQNIAPLLLLL